MLREIYLDESIVVYLKDLNIVTITEDQQEMKVTPMVDGYVVDIDNEFIYLGLPDGLILKTIPHSSVGLIEIMLEPEMMIDLELPNEGDDIH
jgi:hypothetical protein